jgi:hypothetical protein
MQMIQKSASQLFFREYRYSVHVQCGGVALVRSKSHSAIDLASEKYNKSVCHDVRYDILRRFTPIGDIDALHSLIDVLLENDDSIRTTYTDLNNIRIYCNDTRIIDEIKSISDLGVIEVVERVVNQPENAIVLKHSDFKFRSYFSQPKRHDEKWIKKKPLDESFIFRSFGTISGAMKPRPTMIESQMFLDYNDESIITLLSLIKPGIIRKTLDIIVDK